MTNAERAMHWADAQGVDFAEKSLLAQDHYDAEVEEERQHRASLLNFTIVFTDLSGDVHTYDLEALDQSQAKKKFNEEFTDGVNSIDYVITHETSPGYKQLHEALSEMVESGQMRDRGVANLLTQLTLLPKT